MTQTSRETLFAIICFGIIVAWLAFVIGLSYIMRRKSGKPVFAEPPADPVFVEKWASGRSMSSLITRIGGARNCLFIAVTKDRLLIHPHFPFSLMFLPEIYGLDCDIPLTSIHDVSESTVLFTQAVNISFTDKNGMASQMQLFLRKRAEFLQVMADAKKKS